MKAVEHIERPKHICDMSWLKKFGKNKSTDIIDCEPIDEHVLEMFEYTPHEVFFKRPYFQRDVIYI